MSSLPTIFVSIACYMDPDVCTTVADLLAKARHPERLTVGICLQAEPADTGFDALSAISQVKIDRIPATQAKGPIYARYRCEAMLENEDYFLQIDCHTRFYQDWDQILIEEFAASTQRRKKVVLSHYPINIVNMTDPRHLGQIGAIITFRHIGADAIKLHGRLIPMPDQPQPAFGISAAMLFMKGSTKKEIPYDPELHFGLHAAEQFLYSARLWTHGYQVMTPTRHSIATEYITNRERIPLSLRQDYNQRAKGWTELTWRKVKYLLELDCLEQVPEAYRPTIEHSRRVYAMGRKRFLVDYYRQLGLHPQLLTLFPYYRELYGHLS